MRNRLTRLSALALFLIPVQCMVGHAQDIDEVVHGIYMAGVPYETARQFSREDCIYLLDVISREDEASYWSNATTILGIVGGPAVYEPLVRLIEGRDDKFSRTSNAVYNGRLSAVLALGHLANEAHAGHDEAMEYLVAATDPTVLQDLPWISTSSDAITMSVSAVNALSLSGRPEVAGIMEGLVSSDLPVRTRNAAKSVLDALGGDR